jgi:hypothetical protein
MPLRVTTIAPETALIPLVSGTSLAFLALLGGFAACAGGGGVAAGAIRVTFWAHWPWRSPQASGHCSEQLHEQEPEPRASLIRGAAHRATSRVS